jgi:hypothetical protein
MGVVGEVENLQVQLIVYRERASLSQGAVSGVRID